MRTAYVAGLASAAALAIGAISVAFASAEEFVASKTGKLTGKAVNTQEFKTGTGATVDCTGATPEGELKVLKTTEFETTVKYSGCSIAGIGVATVSGARNSWYSPTLLTWLHPVSITAKALGIECAALIDAGQSVGGGTGELAYVNQSGEIEEESKIKDIAYEITKSNSSSLCGTAGEKKEGTYTGDMTIELEGGTIEVK